MRFLKASAFLTALAVYTGAHANEVRPLEPYALARALQFAQDASVREGEAARANVVAAVERMARELPKVHSSVWKEARNARALALFLLSGGSAQVVRSIMASAEIPQADINLLRGALAFAEGRRADASRYLEPLDPGQLPADIGGHVALVQAALISRDKPEQQLAKLAMARLLMAGTVIEESALRRSIDIAASAKKDEQSLFLLEQYHRRFPNSAYAPTLELRVLAILSEQLTSDDSALREQAIAVTRRLKSEQRTAILVEVAQKALRAGAFESAIFSAGHLLAEAIPGTADAARASLYIGAAEIVSGKFDEGVDRLTRVDQKLLDHRHQRLHRAATILAAQMRAWPPAAAKVASKRPDGATTHVDGTINRAETLLVEAGRLLKKGFTE